MIAPLLLKPGRSTEQITTPKIEFDDEDQFEGIRCPQCQWRPTSQDLWCCYSGDGPEPRFEACGTMWHTFATHGLCPGCSHQWQWTSCLRCSEWSRHDDWYERRER